MERKVPQLSMKDKIVLYLIYAKFHSQELKIPLHLWGFSSPEVEGWGCSLSFHPPPSLPLIGSYNYDAFVGIFFT